MSAGIEPEWLIIGLERKRERVRQELCGGLVPEERLWRREEYGMQDCSAAALRLREPCIFDSLQNEIH